VERELVLTAAAAVPQVAAEAAVVDTLRSLRGRCRLALLDDGDAGTMERWVGALGLAACFEARVWTGDLGRQARSPSPYAFRWLSRRLALGPDECTYLGGCPSLLAGARAAAWEVLPVGGLDSGAGPALERCLARLEAARDGGGGR
jgi:FMN phosphatase YigB (HAD superfamily)